MDGLSLFFQDPDLLPGFWLVALLLRSEGLLAFPGPLPSARKKKPLWCGCPIVLRHTLVHDAHLRPCMAVWAAHGAATACLMHALRYMRHMCMAGVCIISVPFRILPNLPLLRHERASAGVSGVSDVLSAGCATACRTCMHAGGGGRMAMAMAAQAPCCVLLGMAYVHQVPQQWQ